MNTESLNNESIRKYIPNVVAEVDDEASLFEKLSPFLESAKLRIEKDFIGPDDFLRPEHARLALKIIVADAFADAVPSLDMVLTPSGFGVVSTEAVTPASKERVERLIASLRDYVKNNLVSLVDICRTYPEWRASERGAFFGATFFPSPNDLDEFFYEVFSGYDQMRATCMAVEAVLAEKYLGRKLMAALRQEHLASIHQHADIVTEIRYLVAGLATSGKAFRNLGSEWPLVANIINDIRRDSALFALWYDEMKDVLDVPAFENNVKGAFFF